MLNDSVREELALKISPLPRTSNPELTILVKKETTEPKLSAEPVLPPVSSIEISSPPPVKLNNHPQTSQIMTKPTSPTLVEFNNKNAMLPDWRLQLQNSVRKRLDNRNTNDSVIEMVQTAPRQVNLVTNGATALRPETEIKLEPEIASNPVLAKALQRINQSREKYLVEENQPTPETVVKPFPQNISNNVSSAGPPKSLDFLPKSDREEIISRQPKQNLIQFRAEVKPENKLEIKAETETKPEKFDTNKLPPIPLPAKLSSSFGKEPVEPAKTVEPRKIELNLEADYLLEFQKAHTEEALKEKERKPVKESEPGEEIEDLAPISLRFNSAIFDLLIGSFLSLVLLSPFMMLNGRFFSMEGLLAFLATFSIVMFIYLTTAIGFLGRTFGMRIFSLEIVDIEENDYPTLHQAAVSSSVYLLSLALGGIGFLLMLTNSEKRAAHDLLSKTIIVKEY